MKKTTDEEVSLIKRANELNRTLEKMNRVLEDIVDPPRGSSSCSPEAKDEFSVVENIAHELERANRQTIVMLGRLKKLKSDLGGEDDEA